MLQILVAIFYITFVCHGWGILCIRLIQKKTNESGSLPLPITWLTGLSLVGILCQALSIFIPMGDWPLQAILLLPALLQMIKKPKDGKSAFHEIIHQFRTLNLPGLLFFICGLTFILLVGTWTITNPDTIGYHAPIIAWNNHFRAIPGIANINGRLGLQSSWFILCAVFNFSFTGTSALTFVNSTILTWLIFFMAQILSKIYIDGKSTGPAIWAWCLLCLICFGVNVQVYLAASSANPDFVLCIFLWTAFYLLLSVENSTLPLSKTIIAAIILVFSVTLKLSAIPVLLLMPFLYLQLKSIAPLNRLLLIGAILGIAIIPFIWRNLIISGYPLFPALYLNYFQADWKADPAMVQKIDDYVSVYARVGYVTIENYQTAGELSFGTWFPLWLGQYTWGEKLLTFASLLASIINLLLIREFMHRKNKTISWIFFSCLAGFIILMIKAPSPRFAQAFMVPIILIAAFTILDKWPSLQPPNWLRDSSLAILFIAIAAYSGYRITKYFTVENILKVNGILTNPVSTIHCNELTVNLPIDPYGCGNAPLPCANNPCQTFIPRGKNIEDGFRPIKK